MTQQPMRNLEPQSARPVLGPSSRESLSWRGRTPADATSTLLELARALRGFASHEGAPLRRRAMVERAFQAVAAEVARAGPLEIVVRGETFDVTDLKQRLDARGGLAELRRGFAEHSIERVCLDAKLTLDALQGFLELLLRPAAEGGDVGSFVRTLASRDARGVRINDLDEPVDTLPRALNATPPRPSLSVTTTLVAQPSAPEPTPDPEAPPIPSPRLESAPLSERLRARLVELDHTLDDEPYARRAAEIVIWAEQVWQAGLRDDAYHAMSFLADHAVGCGGRAEFQARIAADCFAELATGERLEDLIDRALTNDASSVRAAQVLLQRREAVVPVLVDRICALPDPLAASPLHALVLTSGEAAVPTLHHGISGRDENRARVCLRLAGALQSTALLPILAGTAKDSTLGRQLEAIRALCLLPGEAAHQALAEALASQLDQIAIAATQAISENTGIDAVPALLDVLESHMRGSRTQLCRALIEVLGRLGDERAVPRLAAILERKPVLRRAHWHAIQLAAVDALSVLPTREARRAIERAASHAAGPVRDRARDRLSALDTRGEAR